MKVGLSVKKLGQDEMCFTMILLWNIFHAISYRDEFLIHLNNTDNDKDDDDKPPEGMPSFASEEDLLTNDDIQATETESDASTSEEGLSGTRACNVLLCMCSYETL